MHQITNASNINRNYYKNNTKNIRSKEIVICAKYLRLSLYYELLDKLDHNK